LSHVRLFPISALKIDKSFIDGLPDDQRDVAIMNAIVALGDTLEVDVVAEGIERQAQYDCVAEAGVKLVQGYLVSRPLPARTIEELLTSQGDTGTGVA
jgi:EAL domain-containing protein (putative c-di-GMP-specific phosphodiesterase class I)